MSLTLNEVATIAMRFVFAGCCATACRIADAIIRPATKSRRFIDHLIGNSEQCRWCVRAVPSTTPIEADKMIGRQGPLCRSWVKGGGTRDVWFSPDSSGIADISRPPLGANAGPGPAI